MQWKPHSAKCKWTFIQERSALKHRLDQRYKHLEASQSRESLTAWLQSCSPDDTGVLEALCFVAAAPAIVLQFVRDSVKKAGDAIPNEPGRPTALSIVSKRDIVNTIYLLHRKKGANRRCTHAVGGEAWSVQAHGTESVAGAAFDRGAALPIL